VESLVSFVHCFLPPAPLYAAGDRLTALYPAHPAGFELSCAGQQSCTFRGVLAPKDVLREMLEEI
jgi:hypothetical protein